MKSTEVKILKMAEEMIFDINSKMYLDMISIKHLCVFNDSHKKKIELINKFLGNKKIAKLEDGYQFIAQLMLGNPELQKSEVLVRGQDYCSVYAEKKDGIISVWHCNHEFRGEIIGMGAFTDNVLVRAEKPANLSEMVIEVPGKIVKDFLPKGGAFLGSHCILDETGTFWEKDGKFWIKNPKIAPSVSNFLSPGFGGGVMSQSVIKNKLFSLLENGMLFDGQNVCPKNTISEDQYNGLVFTAESLFCGWDSVVTDCGVDYSVTRNVHKNITPCLYYKS